MSDSASDSGEWELSGSSSVHQTPRNAHSHGHGAYTTASGVAPSPLGSMDKRMAAGDGSGNKKDLAHVPCRFFRVGACTAGSACPFSHTPKEPGVSKQPCKWFLKGQCKFGHKCANAHIFPGQPPSMDWKNKKAAKVVAQAEAAAVAGQTSPLAQQGQLQEPSSPAFANDSPQPLQSATFSSGLSNMFGRPGGAPSEELLADFSRDGEGVAIGMSPIGIPLPATLQSSEVGQQTAAAQKGQKPLPLSYASAAASKVTARQVSSPTIASPQLNLASSPHQASAGPLSSPRMAQHQALSPTSLAVSQPTLSAARLSTSVPSAFAFDGPLGSAGLAHSPRAPSAMYAPAHHSPLYAPALQQHSHSYHNGLPSSTRGSLGLASPPLQHQSQSQPPPGVGQRSTSSSSAFGTSPFGNNAIFLSSSHEEEKGAYLARAARSASGRSPATALRKGSSALDDENGEQEGDDDNVLQEELVPSSLKHLLTPDERARKDSRSGGTSGFFAPFDDDDEDARDGIMGEVEEDELDSIQHKYSQSVPAANPFLQRASAAGTYNKAPGSPPTFLSSYFSPPAQSSGSQVHPSSPNTSSLAKHLLSGTGSNGSGQIHQPKVERGFYSSSYVPNSALAPPGSGAPKAAPANGGAIARPRLADAALGTSLPQGLAAGLSRLHLIPAGAERTGYTPTGTPAASLSNAHLSSFPASPPSVNGLNPKASAFGAPGPGPGTSRPSSSFKLPTLGSLGGGGSALPHVGSPLARGEMQGYIGARHHQQQQHQQAEPAAHAKAGEGSNKDEDEDLVFDMDV